MLAKSSIRQQQNQNLFMLISNFTIGIFMLILFAELILAVPILTPPPQIIAPSTIKCFNNTLYNGCGKGPNINITSPSSLIGPIGYQAVFYSPSLQTPNDEPLTGRILIPHSANNNDEGCNAYTYNYANDNTPFAGGILMVRNTGTCTATVRIQRAALLNISLLILVDTSVRVVKGSAPPSFGDSSRITNYKFAQILIGTDDGAIIWNALKGTSGPVQQITISMHSAGHADPINLAAFKGILAISGWGFDIQPFPHIRSWLDINNPIKDPCYDRILGFWCEGGKVVAIAGQQYSITGSIPSVFGNFTSLSHLDLGNNAITSIPDSLCNLNELVFLRFASNLITRMPDCWAGHSKLTYVLMSGNNIQTFPASFAQLSSLAYVTFTSHSFSTDLPDLSTLFNSLQYLDLSSGNIGLTGSIPNFSGFLKLTYLDLFKNSFTSLNSSYLDNIPLLTTLSLQSNNITSPLPNLIGSQTYLSKLSLYSNNFQGPIPASWNNLQQVTSLSLTKNKITSPISVLAQLTNLATLDLSYNLINIYGPFNLVSNSLTVLFNSVTGPLLTSLDLSHNLLTGEFYSGSGILANNIKIQTINFAHNNISNLPYDLFGMKALISADFSNNNLASTATLPTTPNIPSGVLTFFDVSSNPKFISPTKSLPSFATFIDTEVSKLTDRNYFCNAIRSASNMALTIKFDASFYNYQGCTCDSGTYGFVPNCLPIPSNQTITPLAILPALLTGSGNKLVPRTSFSDQWYGTARSLPGIDTTWVLDASNSKVIINATSNLPTFQTISSFQDPDRARVINIYFHIDLSQFKAKSDKIDIFKGDSSLRGELVKTIRGDDELLFFSQISNFPDIVRSTSYNDQYGSEYANFTIHAVIHMNVVIDFITPQISINFQSRKSSGKHFFAAFIPSSIPPSGYHIDPITNLAVRDAPILPIYSTGLGVRVAVYISAGIVSLGVLLVSIVIIYYRSTSLVRASSRPFTALILLMLLTMSGSSVLYAIIPEDYNSSICNARLWLSTLSLMGVLSILTAKSFRVQSIFTSKILTQVKQVTDGYVASIVGILLLIQTIMMIIFTGLNMSEAKLESGSGIGSGYRVWGCNRQNGFNGWIGAEIALFAALMMGAAAIAFRTRAVPSAFNESSHIMASLFLMIFFMIIIVPLDYLVADNPEGAIIIQGCGQCLLALFLLIFNFAPKLFYLLTKRGNDKSLIFTQTSVGAALASKKSSRSGSNSSYSNTSGSTDNNQSRSGVTGGTQLSSI